MNTHDQWFDTYVSVFDKKISEESEDFILEFGEAIFRASLIADWHLTEPS